MKIIQWLRSILYLVVFLLILCVFHIIHLVTLLLGEKCYWRGFHWMNSAIVYALRWAGGIRFTFGKHAAYPAERPVVIIANHQSMFDIPTIIHHFRPLNPRFIAKRELSRGLPAVSLCLRRGGHLLIDRAKRRESVRAIREFAAFLGRTNGCVCIFPEGTRARDGVMRPFKSAGILSMLETLRHATVVPLAITGSWRIVRHRMLPIPRGVHVHCSPLPPMEVPESIDAEFITRIEELIRAELARIESLA